MNDRKFGVSSAILSAAITIFSCGAAAPAIAEATGAQLKALYGSELKVLGDLESVDISRGVLLVAGQHVSLAADTAFSYNGIPVEDQARALSMIQPGDLLVISGPLDAPARSVSRLEEAYVAGATTVFVRAKVVVVQQSLGRAKVDELSVDLTPAMADPQFVKVEPGQVIEAVGIRPTTGGLLLASNVSARSSGGLSIVGTAGAKSIVGTAGAKSIVGTAGAQSIVGTAGAQSIVGTAGAKSIVGTAGAQSIVGTAGAQSIVGTAGAKSIVGTAGAQSIVGTAGAQSIVGTAGAQSIVGTAGAQSIVGTAGAKSIVGTAGAQSIVGTAGAQSIVGTAGAQSIVG